MAEIKRIMEKNNHKNLVIACNHLFELPKKVAFEVLDETYACEVCAENEPKTEEEFMAMFQTICKDCLEKNSLMPN